MSTDGFIDFSTYSDQQLATSLLSINRKKFEHNFAACENEIEKRKATGTWTLKEVKEDPAWLMKSRKLVKMLALVQAVGGVLGILNYLYLYGAPILQGEVAFLSVVLLLIALSVFAFTAYVAWKYWRTEKDNGGLWRLMIGLQVPAFCIGGFNYEFYAGFKIPIGYAGNQLGINVGLGFDVALYWQANAPFALTVNAGALMLLALLSRAEQATELSLAPH